MDELEQQLQLYKMDYVEEHVWEALGKDRERDRERAARTREAARRGAGI